MKSRWLVSVLSALVLAACGGDAPPAEVGGADGGPPLVESEGDLAFEHMASLGGAHEPFSLYYGGPVLGASDGRFAARTINGERLAVFSQQGDVLAVFGERGDGPGELTSDIRYAAFGPGDSLFVVTSGRVTVFDEALGFARSYSLGPSSTHSRLLLPDSRVLRAALVRGPETEGYILHLVSPAGEIVRSFASRSGGGNPQGPMVLSGDAGGVWVMRSRSMEGFRLEQWGLDGTERRSVFVSPEWLSGYSEDMVMPIVELWKDDGELLWILHRVPSYREGYWAMREWHESLPGPLVPPRVGLGIGAGTDAIAANIETMSRLAATAFDTVIEVVDADTGRAIFTGRANVALAPGLGGDILWSRRFDEYGEVTFDVWRATLR